MASDRRTIGIYERWLYRIAIQGTNGDDPLGGRVTLRLPALLTELVLEGEWLDSASETQWTARDALVAHMNAMCPALAMHPDEHLIRMMTSSSNPLEVAML